MTKANVYGRAWRDLDRRRLLLAGLFVFLLFTRFSGPQFFASYDWSFFAPADILGFLLTFVWVAIFPCPKCGKWFNLKIPSWGAYPFNQSCVHCGLQKGQDDSDVTENGGAA